MSNYSEIYNDLDDWINTTDLKKRGASINNLHFDQDLIFRTACENGLLLVAKKIYQMAMIKGSDGKFIHSLEDYSLTKSFYKGHYKVTKWLVEISYNNVQNVDVMLHLYLVFSSPMMSDEGENLKKIMIDLLSKNSTRISLRNVFSLTMQGEKDEEETIYPIIMPLKKYFLSSDDQVIIEEVKEFRHNLEYFVYKFLVFCHTGNEIYFDFFMKILSGGIFPKIDLHLENELIFALICDGGNINLATKLIRYCERDDDIDSINPININICARLPLYLAIQNNKDAVANLLCRLQSNPKYSKQKIISRDFLWAYVFNENLQAIRLLSDLDQKYQNMIMIDDVDHCVNNLIKYTSTEYANVNMFEAICLLLKRKEKTYGGIIREIFIKVFKSLYAYSFVNYNNLSHNENIKYMVEHLFELEYKSNFSSMESLFESL